MVKKLCILKTQFPPNKARGFYFYIDLFTIYVISVDLQQPTIPRTVQAGKWQSRLLTTVQMCGRTALNFNEDDLRAELARANVNINEVRNQPVWRQTYSYRDQSESLTNRHNVAPTYNQPVIRQIGERNDQAQDIQPPNTTSIDAQPISGTTSPTSPKSTSTAKRGDLIVQSMRYVPLYTSI